MAIKYPKETRKVKCSFNLVDKNGNKLDSIPESKITSLLKNIKGNTTEISVHGPYSIDLEDSVLSISIAVVRNEETSRKKIKSMIKRGISNAGFSVTE